MAGGNSDSSESSNQSSKPGTPESMSDQESGDNTSNINVPPGHKEPGSGQPEVVAKLQVENPESKGFFTNIIDFFKPLSVKLTPECREVETAFHTIKERCERIDDLYKKPRSIWDISWQDLKEEVDSIRDSVIDGIRKPDMTLLNTLFPIWYTCYKYMRVGLYDLRDLHEYIAPSIDGVNPVYEISDKSMKEDNIRLICWQLNVNLAHRMFLYGEKFLENSIRFCLQQRGLSLHDEVLLNVPEVQIVVLGEEDPAGPL